MMTKETSLEIMRAQGKADSLNLRERSPSMTGTEIIAEEHKIPDFDPTKDYTTWKPGSPVTDDGQVWLLIQPYNAAHHPQKPAELRAHWGLAHTKDPAKAKPWVAPYGVSGLYMVDEVCIHPNKDGVLHIYRNKHDNNEYAPETLNVEDRWEDLGEA
jgi:hypothetical protein